MDQPPNSAVQWQHVDIAIQAAAAGNMAIQAAVAGVTASHSSPEADRSDHEGAESMMQRHAAQGTEDPA